MIVSILKKTLKDIETELAEQTDRGAAIIACAILDDFLTEALQKRLEHFPFSLHHNLRR